ncbi:hypothetical protein JOB18_021946 [Solea senegalensis]|uniref:Uncharacterized protein n=1 Tax=Solea senegalensis TaxID=28829 RepID=A0AAV6RCS0_SOLSE|nr:hypothetical protein JOB18_021946 [Solea senegalensis]
MDGVCGTAASGAGPRCVVVVDQCSDGGGLLERTSHRFTAAANHAGPCQRAQPEIPQCSVFLTPLLVPNGASVIDFSKIDSGEKREGGNEKRNEKRKGKFRL